MKKHTLTSLLGVVFGGLCAFDATAAVSLFSDYGQIQNVQKYSSNPFWTPNSPYNQRLPQPVYVQGADLNTEDCTKVVQSLVSVQCMARDNCKNTSISDIRPTIMVQLSNLPGDNYVSACAGYIDGIFESYVAQYGNSLPNRAVNFPKAIDANPSLNNSNNSIQIQNPYKQTTPAWKQEIIDRQNELQQLQQQNGAGDEHLSSTEFPTTYADLSFESRMQFESEDYAKYKDLKTYNELKAQDITTWCSGDGSGSQMCNEYAKEHTAAVSSVVDSVNGDREPVVRNEVSNNNDEERPLICKKNSIFNFSTDAEIIFKDIQVHTPEIAQRLVQEFIKCSEHPDLIATKNYTTRDGDKFLEITNTENQIKYTIEFDDVTESSGSQFGIDTIKALCQIAGGISSKTRCPSNVSGCFASCEQITEIQFAEISKLIQELVAPTGEKFSGLGKWFYQVTYNKSNKLINFSVAQGNNVSRIFVE